MIKRIVLGLMVATLTSQVALAGPECTTEPKENWMNILDMQKKIINDYGYAMSKFKVTDGNCYEIYGYEIEGVDYGMEGEKNADESTEDKNKEDENKEMKSDENSEAESETKKEEMPRGYSEEALKKVEIYFNPIDGEIVKKKAQD